LFFPATSEDSFLGFYELGNSVHIQYNTRYVGVNYQMRMLEFQNAMCCELRNWLRNSGHLYSEPTLPETVDAILESSGARFHNLKQYSYW